MRLLRVVAAVACLLVGPALMAVPPVRAAEVTFQPPTATTRLGEPVVFRTTLSASEPPVRVELVSTIPRAPALAVTLADVQDAGDGSYEATVEQDGHVSPNTVFRYRFRALMADGMVIEGPEADAVQVDDRFEWRTLEGAIVRLHWYEGDEAFARRALDIGDKAIEDASKLLGVTETEPVDFFIYASEGPFREALGPGTRENVGGQANSAIRTLFGLIEPNEIGSQWVDVLVTHELTHLVFATAIGNPYHEPPRWLNEGLAVHLSEGLSIGDATTVQAAANSGEIIPLEALGGFFPTTRERFRLAYAESVSAVTFFIETYGTEDLVSLIRSYADGVSDDEAFTAATGADLGAFDAAWVGSLDAELPEPYGPQPAPPGPLPSDWVGDGSAAIPVVPPGAGARLESAGAAVIDDARDRLAREPWRFVAAGIALTGLVVLVAMVAVRRRRA